MNGKVISSNHALRDITIWSRNKILDPLHWRRNLRMARNQSKLTLARKDKEGLEYSYALVDSERKIIKKVMMTSNEAYKRNKVTKLAGLAWVLCG